MLRSACRLLLPLLALWLAACGTDTGQGARGEPPSVPVVAVPVERQPWIDAIQALGTALANESVSITAKVTETVARVGFDDGDTVEVGQVLVALTDRAEVAQLEEAQAAFVEAERQYQRTADLVRQGMLNVSALDQQTAARDAARARMEGIRARLSDRVITAPFAGLLGMRRVSTGTLVTPGTVITTLDDISQIKLDFSLPETFLDAVRPGQRIVARAAAFPGREFEGVVATIDSRVDPVTRAITVRADVPNPEARLRPGMLLTVSVFSAPRESLVVPELALVQVGARHFLFRIDAEQRARQVEVHIGARRAGEVEVLSGVAEGDLVVVEGTVRLRDGSRVVLTEPSPDAVWRSEVAG
ncbi:MAG TPA: efflux RND transporter periplasmic adaptor subunit [Xanthomonadaceae bacterium]|nr:efflux RND transporter periplasmic adaptor subunit [Xanthomonadaceae bacterium]